MKTTRNDLSGWLEYARPALMTVADQPSLEAQALLAGILGCSRAWIFAHRETLLDNELLERLDQGLTRRLTGEPLPYILGKWEFYGLEFEVSPAVLIPRPETELVVDLARDWLKSNRTLGWAVDVGTGSGCIAAALAKWAPLLKIIAIDISSEALKMAMRNLRLLDVHEKVQLLQADLIAPLSGPLHLICANLPYVPSAVLPDLPISRFEPQVALDGGVDGLRLIEPLLQQLASRLAPGGRILLEIEATLGEVALALARSYFPQAHCVVHNDLAGLARVVSIDI